MIDIKDSCGAGNGIVCDAGSTNDDLKIFARAEDIGQDVVSTNNVLDDVSPMNDALDRRRFNR